MPRTRRKLRIDWEAIVVGLIGAVTVAGLSFWMTFHTLTH